MKNRKLQFILIVMFVLLPCVIFFGGCNCNGDEEITDGIEYSVTFYTGSDLSFNYAEQKVKHGEYAKLPVMPVREGYFFVGWYSDQELTKLWKFESDAVTYHLKLYAKWELREENANTDIDIDKTTMVYFYLEPTDEQYYTSLPVDIGGTTIPVEIPMKSGYDFDGWYTDTDLLYKFDFATPVMQELKLYAKWITKKCDVVAHTHEVQFYLGTPLSGYYMTMEVLHGDAVKRIEENPTKDGYTFVGWYSDPERQVKWDLRYDVVTYDLRLFAKFEPNE